MTNINRSTGLMTALVAWLLLASSANAQQSDQFSPCRILGAATGTAVVLVGAQSGVGTAGLLSLAVVGAGVAEGVTYACNNSDEAAEAAADAYDDAMLSMFLNLSWVVNGQYYRPGIPPAFWDCMDVNNCQPLIPPEHSFGQRRFNLDAWDSVRQVVNRFDGGRPFTANTLVTSLANSINTNLDGSLSTYEAIYTSFNGN
jgi:hypothetical protein